MYVLFVWGVGMVGVWESIRMEVNKILCCCSMRGRAKFPYIVK